MSTAAAAVRVKSEPMEDSPIMEESSPPPRERGEEEEVVSFMDATATERRKGQVEDNDDDDDDDEVVREIDVFLSPALASQLYLIQFPLQHQPVVQPDGARIKRRHCMLELDQPLPSNIEQNGVFPMTHRIYNSHTISVSTHMALGKFTTRPTQKEGAEDDDDDDNNNNNENNNNHRTALHLVPLSNIQQMRPSFAHVDEALPGGGGMDVDQPESSSSNKQQEKSKPMLRKESERALLARRNSYAYKKASEDQEPWQNLTICGQDSEQYQQLMADVVCPSQETFVRDTTVKDNNRRAQVEDQHQHPNVSYVRTLNYLPTKANMEGGGGDDDAGGGGGASTEAYDAAGLCARLTTLLRNGFPVPYSLLRYKFPESVPDESILYALGGCAVMVRGNFILHSRLLLDFPRVVQQARTFILFLIQTFGCIHRTRLKHVFEDHDEITTEILSMLLNQVAKKTIHGWKLKIEDDVKFCKFYSEYSWKHAQYWVRQAERFQDFLELYSGEIPLEEEEEEDGEQEEVEEVEEDVEM